MNLKEIKEIALANVSDPTNEYYYRFVCRWFSKTFYTPLPDVYSLSVDEVLLAYFEEGYEKLSQTEDGDNNMKLDAYKAIDPDFDENEDKAVKEFVEMIEAEEEEKRFSKKFKNKQGQSLNSNHQGPQAKRVSKTYNEAVLEEADDQGLEGLDDLTTGQNEDG